MNDISNFIDLSKNHANNWIFVEKYQESPIKTKYEKLDNLDSKKRKRQSQPQRKRKQVNSEFVSV
jgi:hypothetical protein